MCAMAVPFFQKHDKTIKEGIDPRGTEDYYMAFKDSGLFCSAHTSVYDLFHSLNE